MDDQGPPQVQRTYGPGNLQTVIEPVGDCLVLALAGDVDLLTAPAAQVALRRAVGRVQQTLVIDLS